MLFLSLKLDKMIIKLQKRPENEREERPVNDGLARGGRIHILLYEIFPVGLRNVRLCDFKRLAIILS